MARACPHCGDEIDYLKYTCNTYGMAYGTVDRHGSRGEDGEERSDSDNFEYLCSSCDETLTRQDVGGISPYDWIQDEDEDKDEETDKPSDNIWSTLV